MTSSTLFICANYGLRDNNVNGQTMKARVFDDTLSAALGPGNVWRLDLSTLFANPLGFLWQARRGIREHAHTIMMPADKGLQVLLPLFLAWKRKWRRSLRYVNSGSWLPGLLARKSWLRHLCAQLDGIYVEAPSMADKLRSLGLGRVHTGAQFRSFDPNMLRHHAPTGRPFKLVFYSRVTKDKGVEDAIAAVGRLNAQAPSPVVVLDIYGPIRPEYRAHFLRLVGTAAHVAYKGVLTPENVYQVLQQYDLMVLPTYYFGEGFPGAVVEAFIAGLPVLASDWRHNGEIITPGKTGSLCQPHSVDSIVQELSQYLQAPECIPVMRQCCIRYAGQYHPEVALQGLVQELSPRASSATN